MYTLAVVTGTRAEYGLLRPVIKKLQNHPIIQCNLIATGAHLKVEYGNTIREIENDCVNIGEKIDILSMEVPEGREGTAQRTALALHSFITVFSENRPDAVLLLGDRYEIFAVAQAAALLDIPIAHISGGDVTHGADDDWFRHCITKMAKLHFPSCEEYRRRIIRMGEQPGCVYNVGGLGDENIRNLVLYSRKYLEESLEIALPNPYALVTFHPETASNVSVDEQIEALLQAIEKTPHLFYLITKANADAGGERLNRRLEEFCKTHENAVLHSSLGVVRYLSAMKYAALVVGNSSSGVVETPSFGVPTVDIGQRQAGRLRCKNVIHSDMKANEIANAIEMALEPSFAQKAKLEASPYNGGDTSGKIVALLEKYLKSGSWKAPKIFYDGE